MEEYGEVLGLRHLNSVIYEEPKVTILKALIFVAWPPHLIWGRRYQLSRGKMTSIW